MDAVKIRHEYAPKIRVIFVVINKPSGDYAKFEIKVFALRTWLK